MTVLKLIHEHQLSTGVYLRINDEMDDDPLIFCYDSMQALYDNRDRHRMFFVNQTLPGASRYLRPLHNHCMAHEASDARKVLLVDRHQCEPGCTVKPDLVTSTELYQTRINGAYQKTHPSTP